MKINYVHDFNMELEEEICKIQTTLSKNISLKNNFDIKDLKTCAGVDIAYWTHDDKEYGGCSIVVIDMETKEVLEKVSSYGVINEPYIPGYLAFRELPLILKAVEKLNIDPDIFMFDGNGYLHFNHMGIATHASIFLNKPTIGVAKSYLKIDGVDFEMPDDEIGAYKDIIINNEVYGRTIRTRKGVKPVFISCGNYIDLDTATEITLKFVTKESRIPIPTRLADIETHIIRKEFNTLATW